ncbi:MAG: DUF2437 domain-containing protein, partial [Chloroflexi bacterium]|nr:DUF2437 domain-containing protein [Chloroflexota bacterium]
MRIVRYQINGNVQKYGWMLDDKIGEIVGDIFGEYRRREAKTSVADVKLITPCVPSKI